MIHLKISEQTENAAAKYERERVPEGAVMIYGTSDFAALAASASLPVVNRSLADCRMEELLFFYPRLVRPCKPSTLIVGGFLNEYFNHTSVAEIMFLLNRILAYARTDMPGIKLKIVDFDPSVEFNSIAFEWSRFKRYRRELNEEFERYCAAHPDTELLRFETSPHFFKNTEDCGEYDKIDAALFTENGRYLNSIGMDRFHTFLAESLGR